MTTATMSTTARSPLPTRPISPLTRLAIELRKLVDTRAMMVLLGVTLALSVVMVGFARAISGEATVFADLTGAGMLPLVTLLPVLGVLAACAEWRHRTAMTAYVLDPRRSAVLAAKLVAVLIAGVALVLPSVPVAATVALATGMELPGPGALAGQLVHTVAGLAVLVLVGFAVGAALLSIPGALVLVLIGPSMLPQLLSLSEASARITPYVDINGVVYQTIGGAWPQDMGAALSAVTLWIVAPLAIGFWRNARLEA